MRHREIVLCYSIPDEGDAGKKGRVSIGFQEINEYGSFVTSEIEIEDVNCLLHALAECTSRLESVVGAIPRLERALIGAQLAAQVPEIIRNIAIIVGVPSSALPLPPELNMPKVN